MQNPSRGGKSARVYGGDEGPHAFNSIHEIVPFFESMILVFA
jgi:hypothetical protein